MQANFLTLSCRILPYYVTFQTLLRPQTNYTEKKTDESQKFPSTGVTSKNIKNDTVHKADKSRSFPVTYIYNKSTQIE